jgi:hypothetical protein
MGLSIFLVENDLGFGKQLIRTLGRTGHKVAEWCKSLRPEDNPPSPDSIHAKHFDLALIDRRAADDNDENDVSGEEFAVKLCQLGTPAVLVTAYLPPDSRVSLFRTGGLTGIVDKNLSGSLLIECVREYELTRKFPNGFVRFEWEGSSEKLSSDFWSSVGKRLEKAFGKKSLPTPEEFDFLFRKLVSPYAVHMTLERVSEGRSGACIVRARVSCGDGPLVEDLAIKYGKRMVIQSEATRYDRFVGPLPDGVGTQLRWEAYTENLGALAYSWVSDSIEDAVAVGPLGSKNWSRLTWQRRRNAIARLFSVSLNPWYDIYRKEVAKLRQSQSLMEYYTQRGGLWYKMVNFEANVRPKMQRNLEESGIRSANRKWIFNDTKLDDPVEWITRGAGSKLKFSRQSPIHGDLHVANIFVLPDDSPRLIDFGRTALGHVYRDFAALETSIRQTCVSTTNREFLREAEDRICEAKTLGEYIDYRNLGEGKELDDRKKEQLEDLKEAVRTTMEIRRAALDATGGQSNDRDDRKDMQEYLFAVVMHMLRYATGRPDEIKGKDSRRKARIRHALYAAAKAATAANELITKT